MPKRKERYTVDEVAKMLWGEDSGSESSSIEADPPTIPSLDPAEMDSVFVSNDDTEEPENSLPVPEEPQPPPPPPPVKRKRGRPRAPRPVPVLVGSRPMRPDTPPPNPPQEEADILKEMIQKRGPEITHLNNKKKSDEEGALLDELLRRDDEDRQLLYGEWRWDEFDTERVSLCNHIHFFIPQGDHQS